MKILFTTQALSIGGIEVLALRLSEAFAKAGHTVTLYDFNPDRRNHGLVAQYDTTAFRLEAMEPAKPLDWLIWRVNAVLHKTRVMREFRQWLIEQHFARFARTADVDVVCSLSFHQDFLSCRYFGPRHIPVVVSMHGTYEYAAPEWQERARFIYDRTRAIIYAADKNMSWYESQPYYRPGHPPSFKIYTGTDLQAPIAQHVTRATLGIAESAFVYILVARGIAEKGWREAIEAFMSLQRPASEAALLLVGEGEALTSLRAQYQHVPGIVFHGFHPNSVELTQLADVGLLPTYFPIETLPNVIIDYLRCSLPVITTDIGEIREMLRVRDEAYAGTVLPLAKMPPLVDVVALAQAMRLYLEDDAFYQQQVEMATQAAKKFDIRECVARYTQVFHQVMSQ